MIVSVALDTQHPAISRQAVDTKNIWINSETTLEEHLAALNKRIEVLTERNSNLNWNISDRESTLRDIHRNDGGWG